MSFEAKKNLVRKLAQTCDAIKWYVKFTIRTERARELRPQPSYFKSGTY